MIEIKNVNVVIRHNEIEKREAIDCLSQILGQKIDIKKDILRAIKYGEGNVAILAGVENYDEDLYQKMRFRNSYQEMRLKK